MNELLLIELSGDERSGKIPSFDRTDGNPDTRKWRLVAIQPFSDDSNNFWIAIHSNAIPDCGQILATEGDGKYEFEVL